MTNAISAVPGISALSGLTPTTATTSASGSSGAGFSSVLGGVVDNLSDLQSTANNLAVQAVDGGDLTDIHQATLAATRAQVTMDLVSAVRNQGIQAFNSIMNMSA